MDSNPIKALLEKAGLARRPGPSQGWLPPRCLDQGAIGAFCCAMDRHGRGQAIWEHGGNLWTEFLGPGTGPALGALPLGPGREPRIAKNLAGAGVAAWIKEGARNRSLAALLLDPGKPRGTVLPLFSTAGQIRHLQVAVDRRGGALLVWSHELGGESEILTLGFNLRAQAWDGQPTRLGARVRDPVEPRLAMNRRGQAMVLWEGRSDGGPAVLAAFHLPAMGQWSDQPVLVASGPVREVQAAMDHAGNLLLLGVNQTYGQLPTLEARYYLAAAGVWMAPRILATAQRFRQVQLAMTGTGEALAVWLQSEGTAHAYLRAKAFRAGSWEEAFTRLDAGAGRVSAFALALGAKGMAALFGLAQRQEGQVPQVQTRGTDWSPPMTLAGPRPDSLGDPRFCLSAKGCLALWRAGSGAQAQLLASQRGALNSQ